MQNALLETFIKLPFVFKTFVLFIFEWPFKTRLILYSYIHENLIWKSVVHKIEHGKGQQYSLHIVMHCYIVLRAWLVSGRNQLMQMDYQ